ncbi:MAG: leucyl/phenylalanyl-tRNA--protein transferase [Pseudomonadota bacterium]
MPRDTPEITAETLLMAYASGVFPMAETRDDEDVFWVDPKLRGVLPLDRFHLSRRLAKTLRQGRFHVTLDQDFGAVVAGCANRPETWINTPIARLYGQLHRLGFAHSYEVRDTDGDLVGGVYGVALGAAFFGESMFSDSRDASKIALAHAVAHLHGGGFTLFDTQFLTPHLASLGGQEIKRDLYHARLRQALAQTATLSNPVPSGPDVATALGKGIPADRGVSTTK